MRTNVNKIVRKSILSEIALHVAVVLGIAMLAIAIWFGYSW